MSERAGIDCDFPLADDRSNVSVKELDWIFDRDDMRGAGLVHVVDHGRERRAFAASSSAGDEDQTALLGGDLLEHPGKVQLFDRPDLHGNDAEHEPNRSTLLKHVDPETPETRNAVCQIELLGLFELLSLRRRQHGSRHRDDFFEVELSFVSSGGKGAADAQHRIAADFHVNVRGAVVDSNSQKIIDVHASETRGQGSGTRDYRWRALF